MTPEETADFWHWVRWYIDKGQRKGQAMMNALFVVTPELYDDISNSRYDIFYNDTSQDIYRFRDYLGI